jgi:hypothetical protein
VAPPSRRKTTADPTNIAVNLSSMGEPTTDSSHTGRNTGLALVIALVLYVLSAGPALKFEHTGSVSPNFVKLMYAPLVWCHDHEPKVFGPWLDWYCRLWLP